MSKIYAKTLDQEARGYGRDGPQGDEAEERLTEYLCPTAHGDAAAEAAGAGPGGPALALREIEAAAPQPEWLRQPGLVVSSPEWDRLMAAHDIHGDDSAWGDDL
ncbi:hypothetical protein [Phenylobacterium sp.]|jgi:hypothetical protein|uniref:hypothetical protein n=1 Tax=Phenylobacterium sp. TaxID=1871053 RepID=UPI002F95DFE5